MIQLQVIIDVPPGTENKQISVNRLSREDANPTESLFADAFEEQFKATLDVIVKMLKERDIEISRYKETGDNGEWVNRVPSEDEEER